MKKVRFLALAVVAALLLIFPAIVMGQPLQDHQSRLMVNVDGNPAPDDTKVTAMIDGEDAGSAMTMNGIAFLSVPGTGSTVGMEISFMVGDLMAMETDTWERGGHQDKNFELNASTGPPTATPRPTSTPDLRGKKGDPGDAGPAGAKGATGSKGSAGAKGADGAAGAAGPKGDTGAKGSTGAAGNAGSDGAAGAAGADGAAGEAGTKGDRGSAGIAGGGGGLGIIALILAIVALLGVAGVFFVSRSS